MQIENLSENIQIINYLSKFDGEKRYIATGSLEGSKINFDSAEKIIYNDRPSRASQQAENGDLIFAKMQGTDKTLVIDETNKDNIYSSGFFLIRPNESLDKNYLYQFLRSRSFHEQKDKLCTGATQKALTLNGLKQIQIPLPPLSTQRAIATKLDKLQSLIDLKKQSIAKTDDLAKSIFLEMFGDPMVSEKKWQVNNLKELVEEFKYGTSEKSTEKGLPVLRIPNIVNGIDLSDLKYCNLTEKENDRYLLKKGDILFVRTNGNPNFVGRNAIFNLDGNYIFASYLIRTRVKIDLLNPIFLLEYLKSKFGMMEVKKKIKTSAGQYNINTEGLGSLNIPLPPLPLQQKFADIITKLEATKEKHKQALAKLEDLYQAEMQRSFSL